MKRIYEDDGDSAESFARRKDKRSLRGRRSSNELLVEEEIEISTGTRFTDPELQHLFERRKIDDLVCEIKSGKEATVYLVTGPEGSMAAKVYADIRVRSFRNDGVYRSGRWIGDPRIEKAIAQRSARGISAQQDLWVLHEYVQLWELFRAGVPVPRPMIGPDKMDLGDAGKVVLMEFIGEAQVPAPRLADVALEADEAMDAFRQSVDIAAALYGLGKVHGDLSTYNLLWWKGRVVAIDFPQMVDVNENREANALLERDVDNLCRSFRSLDVFADPRESLERVRGG